MKIQLSKTQLSALDEIRKCGTELHFMPYRGSFCSHAYYFQSGTMKHYRFATISKLIEAGFLKKINISRFDEHDVVLVEN